MKAVLKFCLGLENVDLERMDLYDLDMYLMENFNDSTDLRLNSRYYNKIESLLEKKNDRENLKHPNGSIRIFLENDDGTPIHEKRVFNEGKNKEKTEIVQKQIRVLYNKDIENYTRYGMNNFLILRYQENPEELRTLLKKLYLKLTREYNHDDRNMNNFMNYNLMLDLQRSMFNDIKSLFTEKRINITNKRKYDQLVFDFIHSVRFKNLDDLYLNIREDVAKQIDLLKIKPKKIIHYEPIEEKSLDELLFAKDNDLDEVKKELIVKDYLRIQQENKEFMEMEEMGTRIKRK